MGVASTTRAPLTAPSRSSRTRALPPSSRVLVPTSSVVSPVLVSLLVSTRSRPTTLPSASATKLLPNTAATAIACDRIYPSCVPLSPFSCLFLFSFCRPTPFLIVRVVFLLVDLLMLSLHKHALLALPFCFLLHGVCIDSRIHINESSC